MQAAYGIKATVTEQLVIIIRVFIALFIILTPNVYEAKARYLQQQNYKYIRAYKVCNNKP